MKLKLITLDHHYSWLNLPTMQTTAPNINMLRSDLAVARTQDFNVANVFIVSDVTHPGQRVQWQAMFRTCRVVSLQMLLSGHGPWSQMAPNFTTSHYLHVTDAFEKEHTYLAGIVKKRLRTKEKDMRWKLVDFDTWQDKQASATGRRFPLYCLALVTEAEKRSRDWQKVKGRAID